MQSIAIPNVDLSEKKHSVIVKSVGSKTTVWRRQKRFAEAGVEGLLSDKTRPPGKARISTGKSINRFIAEHNKT